MKKIIIVLILFLIDRATKIYLLNLQSSGVDIDFYVFPFLNLYLIWNTGIGFGLLSSEINLFYHMVTGIIALVNIGLIYLLVKAKNIYIYFYATIIGGSLGNLFDRVYYYAVPDFIDVHFKNFHWFVFNVADIFITLGIIGLIYMELIKSKKNILDEKK
jgi:signal peptidase II